MIISLAVTVVLVVIDVDNVNNIQRPITPQEQLDYYQ